MTRDHGLTRFLVVVGLIAATAVLLRARAGREQQPSAMELTAFPSEIGEWRSRTFDIDPSVREVLGPGDFLSRIYYAPGRPSIDFFIAYFASQRTGNTIHSPKNCLPGSGWTPLDSSVLRIAVPDRGTIAVNRYLIGKGADRQLVLYWYQAHDRVVASEYWARFYLVADAVRMNRSDGALVRIVTPVAKNESVNSAQDRAVTFAKDIYPKLPQFIPR